MTTEDFAKFVESQQDAGFDRKTDWMAIRDEWLTNLNSLHVQIQGFLEEYTASGSITYDFSEVEVIEPEIGRYTATAMNIRIGRQHVRLEPIGTLLIGCRGRVDAIGSSGRAQFLLIDERVKSPSDLIRVKVGFKGEAAPLPEPEPPSSWVWKILTNATQRRFVDLSKEHFFAVLMEIANA